MRLCYLQTPVHTNDVMQNRCKPEDKTSRAIQKIQIQVIWPILEKRSPNKSMAIWRLTCMNAITGSSPPTQHQICNRVDQCKCIFRHNQGWWNLLKRTFKQYQPMILTRELTRNLGVGTSLAQFRIFTYSIWSTKMNQPEQESAIIPDASNHSICFA